MSASHAKLEKHAGRRVEINRDVGRLGYGVGLVVAVDSGGNSTDAKLSVG